ncbi:MAG: acyltransferase [Bacteroidota bacterium]|nr:acyltransferase [Bacteroidota bacterium]
MTVASLPYRAGYVNVLDPLRGIASLAVVLFHYSGSILPTLLPNLLTGVLDAGKYGVHVFFVISGFVIPYAMYRSKYVSNDIGNFMARRCIRIAPPAYIAACGMIAFHFTSLWWLGRPVDSVDWPGLNARSVIGNIIFHPDLLATKWFNFPYWTLMIEFQFYLIIALILPIILHAERRWISITIISAVILLTLIDGKYFFHYSPFFMLGTAIFLKKNDRMGSVAFILIVVACCVLAAFHGWIALLIAGATGSIIFFDLKFQDRFSSWLGRISYSLYIVHVPVGYFAEAAIKRVTDLHLDPMGKILLLVFYTVIALVSAHLFHNIVEKPFMDLSKRTARKKKAMFDTPAI